jgi:hypothetical protein
MSRVEQRLFIGVAIILLVIGLTTAIMSWSRPDGEPLDPSVARLTTTQPLGDSE